MPKPPPTSGAWTRTRSSGSLKMNSASWRRMPCSALPGQFEVHRAGRGVVARDAGARLDRRDDDAVVHHLDSTMCAASAHRLAPRPRRRRAGRGRRDCPAPRARSPARRRRVPRGRRPRRRAPRSRPRSARPPRARSPRCRPRRRPPDRRHGARGHRPAPAAAARSAASPPPGTACGPARRPQDRHGCRPRARRRATRRRRNVDPLDERMGMRRAQHVAIQASRHRRCRRRSGRGPSGTAHPRAGAASGRSSFVDCYCPCGFQPPTERPITFSCPHCPCRSAR